MIHISQGHEKGVGLEVFLKCINTLPKTDLSKLVLHCNREVLAKHEEITKLRIPHKLAIEEISIGKTPLSTLALESALSAIIESKFQDILFTLPTSKDQLQFQQRPVAGHTEFFRCFFQQECSMLFRSLNQNVLLITDHIPLAQVPATIKFDLIVEKIKQTVAGMTQYFGPLKTVIVSGLNPHAGEGGMLGSEEVEITKAIQILSEQLPNLTFFGPLPGDTLHLHSHSSRPETLMVYMYHDQGLSYFKGINGTFGANITLGLPFLRLSVDHGTAFHLYAQNTANFDGCLFVLTECLKIEDYYGKKI